MPTFHTVLGAHIRLQILASERWLQEQRDHLIAEGWTYDGMGRWTHPDKPEAEIWED